MMTFFGNRIFGNRISKSSTVATLGASIAVATTPLMFSNMAAFAQTTSFSDVDQTYWARPFIEQLAKEGVIEGFPDGTFKPDQAVTRAQFAAILRRAFTKGVVRNARSFSDIKAKYWAIPAIDKAYTTGFVSGYPDGTFRPEQQIPKVQALVSLSSGLQLDPPADANKSLSAFRDATEIPDYAKNGIAAATQKSLVVNYPNVAFMNPNETATRADIAAFVYQALVSQGKMLPLPADSKAVAYVVNYSAKGAPVTPPQANDAPKPNDVPKANDAPDTAPTRPIARGTVMSVKFPGGNDVKLLIAPGDTLQTNFEVAENILGPKGGVLIPSGSTIQGRFQPASINGTNQGTQYFADKLVIKDATYDINATSEVLVPTSQQALSSNPNILSGGLPTAAARVVLGQLLGGGGGLNLGSLILGQTLGGGGSVLPTPNDQKPSGVIVVEPSKLKLTVQTGFKVANQLGDRPVANLTPGSSLR